MASMSIAMVELTAFYKPVGILRQMEDAYFFRWGNHSGEGRWFGYQRLNPLSHGHP